MTRMQDIEIALAAALRVASRGWHRYTRLRGSNRPREIPRSCLVSLRLLEDSIEGYRKEVQREAKERAREESLQNLSAPGYTTGTIHGGHIPRSQQISWP